MEASNVDAGGMGYEATMYLLERGVRVTVQTHGNDAPFSYTAERYAADKDAASSGKDTRPVAILVTVTSKKCTGTKRRCSYGFTVSCFPQGAVHRG